MTSDDAANTGPLAGVRILDITSLVMGPYATQLLGDLGADVISIEPSGGDGNRVMSAGPHPELSGVALNLLRNKRNVSLDFKHPGGHRALMDIAATCDVWITNLRPATLARAGISYADVKARRSDIVYCEAHGYASDSDLADDPAYDDVIQAQVGIADATARIAGRPMITATIMADKVCGMTVVYSVLAALYRRATTGAGEHIEVPMVDTMTAFTLMEHGAAAIPQPPLGKAGYDRVLNPNRRPWPTKDGWMVVLPYTKEHYDSIFRAAMPDLLGDDRYSTGRKRIEHSEFLYGRIGGMLSERTTAEWVTFFRELDVPAAEVAELDELVQDLPFAEHPRAGRFRLIPPSVRFGGAPQQVRRPAPLIGEHTDEVLLEVGYEPHEIASLRQSGALGTARDEDA